MCDGTAGCYFFLDKLTLLPITIYPSAQDWIIEREETGGDTIVTLLAAPAFNRVSGTNGQETMISRYFIAANDLANSDVSIV